MGHPIFVGGGLYFLIPKALREYKKIDTESSLICLDHPDGLLLKFTESQTDLDQYEIYELTPQEKRIIEICAKLNLVKIPFFLLYQHFKGGYADKKARHLFEAALDGLYQHEKITAEYKQRQYVRIVVSEVVE